MSNLKTTEIFSLDVAPIKWDKSEELQPGYAVTNRKTDVVEYETFMLAEALAFIEQTEPVLQELFADKSLEEVLHS